MPSPLRKRSKREGHHLMTKGISDILSIVYFNFGLEIWEMAFICSETFLLYREKRSSPWPLVTLITRTVSDAVMVKFTNTIQDGIV